MKAVVDSNIIISAILSPSGAISDILLDSNEFFHFYAPSFILDELAKHQEKILKYSGLNEKDFAFASQLIFRSIQVSDVNQIQADNWKKAWNLASDIDENDTPFVALTLELQAVLWTGDKKLIKGLEKKGIKWALPTFKIQSLRDQNPQ